MTITTTLANNLRHGILDAKADLATGGECYDHEPLVESAAFDGYGGGLIYNRAAEKAYWRVMDHAHPVTT